MTTSKKTATAAPANPQTDRNLRTVPGDDLITMLRQVAGFGSQTEQEFSTGSLGYRTVGKAVDSDGVRYQVTIQAVRIDTKQK